MRGSWAPSFARRTISPGSCATVERWVAQRNLVAIRYSLDAKPYIMCAGEVAWSAFSTDLAPALATH